LLAIPPAEPDENWVPQLISKLLAVQCGVAQVEEGAILARGDGVNLEVVAANPPPQKGSQPPQWLVRAVVMTRQILADPASRNGPWQGLYPGENESSSILILSLSLPQTGEFIGAFPLKSATAAKTKAAQQRLVQTARMLESYDQQVSIHGPAHRVQMIKGAVQALSSVQRQQRFLSAAMAMCNEMTSLWSCERVSLGLLRGRMVHMKAFSHAEHFSRKSKIVQDIEAAMEECLDQDTEIVYPPSPQATVVCRAAADLSGRHGSKAVLSIPLRAEGALRAVVLLERMTPFDGLTVEAAKLTCDLCGPAVLNLRQHDRWFGSRWAGAIRRVLALLVGAQYTWTKLAAALVIGLIVFVAFGEGDYRVQAPFVLEATVQQSICAPFDGFVKAASVEVGDAVQADGPVLAELDTADLKLQLASAKAEHVGYLKQQDAYMRDGDTAKAQMAQADADRVQAEIGLLAYTIGKARLTSPITGTIVSGELKRHVGAPVKTGEVLFEVTPIESLRAEILVPEDQILDLAVGQQGNLATASYPGERFRFVVERLNPMAEVVNGQNVFKVRARLDETLPWMRPGMEGVAKVTVDRRPYLKIWTRKLVNWVRLKLWM
jgi:biotin carboxyl carrier protein